MYETVETDSAPLPVGAYSQAVVSGGLVFTAGQIGICPESGKLLEGIELQTERVLDNLESVLIEAGSGLDRVIRMNLYITDMADFSLVNAIYSTRFSSPYPARSTVQVAALPLGASIEMDAVAEVKGEYS
jgi:2-iminobutanoate/2-iminopropanoate deaminase